MPAHRSSSASKPSGAAVAGWPICRHWANLQDPTHFVAEAITFGEVDNYLSSCHPPLTATNQVTPDGVPELPARSSHTPGPSKRVLAPTGGKIVYCHMFAEVTLNHVADSHLFGGPALDLPDHTMVLQFAPEDHQAIQWYTTALFRLARSKDQEEELVPMVIMLLISDEWIMLTLANQFRYVTNKVFEPSSSFAYIIVSM